MIELMVVVATMVVLLGLTAPPLSDFIVRNQVASSQSSLVSSLAFARSEAARRGTTVFVVAAAGGSTGNEYANGWDVYADNDADGVFGSADAPSLRHYEALPSKVILHGGLQVAFGADGYLAPAAAMTFRVCQAAAKSQGYLVTVPPSGIADVSEFRVSNEAECAS